SKLRNASGSLVAFFSASGVILPTEARASVTAVSVSFSKLAAPLTVCTRFGTRSARRWYTFSTCAHCACTPWSRETSELYEPIVSRTASKTAAAIPRSHIVDLRMLGRWGDAKRGPHGERKNGSNASQGAATPPCMVDLACLLDGSIAPRGADGRRGRSCACSFEQVTGRLCLASSRRDS